MARMSLDTAIRLSAEVKGGANITKVQREIQNLAASSKLTAYEMGTMRVAALQLAKANDGTVAGIRSSIAALRGLKDQAKIGSQEFRAFGADIQKLEGKLRGLDAPAKAAGASLGRNLAAGLAAGLATLGVGQAVRGSLEAVVAGEESQRRLRSLSQGLDEYSRVQATATAAAQKFGASQTQTNQEFAQIYARLRPIGLTLEEISTVYNGFNTAAKLSGTTSTEASAAFLQLSQALGTGVLRGEELNSVFEQTPAVVQGIAQVMGVPIGQIRDLAKEGKITGDIVLEALSRIEKSGAPKLAEAMKGPAQQFKNLQIAGQELQIELGQALLPATLAIAKAALELAQGFNRLPEPVKGAAIAVGLAATAAVGLAAAVVALKAGLAALGGTTVVLGALGAGFASVGVAATAAWAAITGPIGLAVLAIAGVTAAAYAMSPPFREFLDEMPARFATFWSELGSDANDAVQRITGLAKELESSIGSTVDRIGQSTQGALQSIITKAESLVPAMQPITQGIGSLFSDAFSFIENRWQQAVANMINFSSPLMTVLKAAGIDVGSAAASAMGYQSGAKRLEAGSTATYTVGGITYDTATGAPVKPPPAFVPAMSAPAVTPSGAGAAAGGGGAVGGGGGKPKPAKAAQLVEHLHGDPSRRGYDRAGHGTQSNAHDHFGFSSEAATRYVMKELQTAGITTTRFGAKSGHSRNSMHYRNQAFDVPWAQFGSGPIGERDFKQSRRVEALVKDALARFNGGTGGGDGGENMREMARQEELDRQQQAKAREDGLRSSGRSAAIAKLNFDLSKATTEEAKLQSAFDRERAERMYRFSGQLAEAKSTEQQINLMREQGLEATKAQVDLDQKLVELAKDRVVELAKQQEAAMRPMLDSIEQKQAQLGGPDAVRALERRNAVGSMTAAGVDPARARALFDENQALDQQISKQQELKELYQGINSTIEEGIIGSMQSGIDSLIDGTQRLDQALKEVLSGVLRDISSQLLRFAVNSALKVIPGFADGGVFGAGGVTAFANGGIVNQPTMFKFAQGGAMQNGLMGEAGPEAIMPLRRGADGRLGVDASGMPVPYQRQAGAAATNELAVPYQASPAAAATGELAVPYQSGGQALSVPFLKGGGDTSADGMQASIDVKFETVRIGSMDFVTREEAQRIGQESAQRGAELASKRYRNSPSARRRDGIR